MSEVSEKYGIIIANVFHAGDGNLHPCMLFDEREPGVKDKAMAGASELMEYCVEMGGSLSGEHGIGLEKKQFMPLVYTEQDMATMKLVRDSFAPSNLLNPGKIFPDGEEFEPAMQSTPRQVDPGMYV